MKKYWVLGLALILLGNLLVLLQVYGNRQDVSGKMRLTERELTMPYGYRRENSGITLQLQWRMSYLEQPDDDDDFYRRRAFPLSKVQQEEWGLASEPARQGYRSARARTAYVVLEYDGEAHRKALAIQQARVEEWRGLETTEQNQKGLERRQNVYKHVLRGSRLYAVDVGLDRAALEQRYSSARHLILPAVVRPRYTKDEGWRLNVEHLQVASVYVPRPYRDRLAGLEGRRRQEQSPRFVVDVQWGARGEPWVAGLELLTVSE